MKVDRRKMALRLIAVVLLLSFATAASPMRLDQAHGFQAAGQPASLVLGQVDFTSSSPKTTPNGLQDPFRVAFDSSGNLWVADENNNRAVRFPAPLGSGENASLVVGQPDLTSAHHRLTQDGLEGPVGVAIDPFGNLWVTDNKNNRVLEFQPPFKDGQSSFLVIGQMTFTSDNASTGDRGLRAPVDATFDQSGNMWVADRLNNRVLEFEPPFASGQSASLVIGQPDLSGNAPAASQEGLNAPETLTFDSSGSLWVVDQGNNRILEFRPPFTNGMGAFLEIGHPAGPGQFTSSESGAGRASFSAPVGLAFDASDNLWMSDRINNRVMEFLTPFSDGENASLVVGQPDFITTSPGTTAASLHNPLGIAFDKGGNLWVADQINNRVLEFRPDYSGNSPAQPQGAPTTPLSPFLVGSLMAVVVVAVAILVLRRRRRRP